MSHFPKDEAEWLAAEAFTYARDLLNITQHVLDDSLDHHAIQAMIENVEGMDKATTALNEWIKKVRDGEDDIGA